MPPTPCIGPRWQSFAAARVHFLDIKLCFHMRQTKLTLELKMTVSSDKNEMKAVSTKLAV